MLPAGAASGGWRHASRGAALAVLLAALAAGCVSRKLFLRSDPPGATVILDGRVAGTTPYEADIPAWGTRNLELRLPGREPVVTDLSLDTPWWDHWPLDMFAAAAPWTIRVDREFAYTLAPAATPDLGWGAAEQALQRARAAGAPEPRP